MTDNPLSCEYCGSTLTPGTAVCEACGQPVKNAQALPPPQTALPQTIISSKPEQIPPPSEPMPSPVYQPAPAYVPPATPPKRRSSLPIILGVGCLLIILCIILVAVLAFLFFRANPQVGDFSRLISIEAAQGPVFTNTPYATQVTLATRAPGSGAMPTATQVPLATQFPTPTMVPQPTEAVLPILVWKEDTIQQLNDTYFSENFANNQYGWADVNDEVQSWSFEEGHYVLHLYKAEFSAWAYLPSEFTPTTIGFDAAVLPGFEQGGYGVICYYQDEDNYHAVTIDPYYREYTIGYAQNGEYQTLLEEMWMPSQAMKDSSYDINQVLVICDPHAITLFINDTLETQIPVSSMTGGVSAIYGQTWEDTPPDGFKVFFDNLYAFSQAQ